MEEIIMRTPILILICLLVAIPCQAGIIYVDADANGANDGSSWADAYNYLQDALAVAGDGNDIWVAEGTYTPDSNSADPNGSGDREATFQLINGVAIRGGYAGFGEPDPNNRDVELYETVLSGDLSGNDVAVEYPKDLFNEPTRSENSYNVTSGRETDSTAVIDGFTITAGNANGSYYYYFNGGGINNVEGGPTILNCRFISNSANHGGGAVGNVYNGPNVVSCEFIGSE
jgi:hypothetical protein